MKIQSAEIQDIEPIISLWKETNLFCPWNNPEEDIKRALSTPTSTLLVAKREDRIIGTVMVGYDGHRGWIYYLAVSQEYQKNGIGKQLMEVSESWLRERGVPKLLLMVRNSNEAVLQFYTALGYEDNDVVVLGKWLNE